MQPAATKPRSKTPPPRAAIAAMTPLRRVAEATTKPAMTPPPAVRTPSTPPARPSKTPKTTEATAAPTTPWHQRLVTKVYAGRLEVRATHVREPILEADAALLIIRWAALLSPRTPVVELSLDDASLDLDAEMSASPPPTTKADAVSAVLSWLVLRLLALLLSDARIVLRRCRVARKQYVATVASATVDVSLSPPRVAAATPRDAVASALRAAAAGAAGTRGSVALAAEGVDAKRRAGEQVLAADRLSGSGCVAISHATSLEISGEADGSSIRGREPQAFRATLTAMLRDGAVESGDGALTAATAAEDALSIALSIENGRRSLKVEVAKPLDEVLPRSWMDYFGSGDTSSVLDIELEAKARTRVGLVNDDGSVVALVVEEGGRLATSNNTTKASASLEIEIDDDTVLRVEDARLDATPSQTAVHAAAAIVRCTPSQSKIVEGLMPTNTTSKGKLRLDVKRLECTLFDGADASDRRAFCVHLFLLNLAAVADNDKVAARCGQGEVYSRGPRATSDAPALKAFSEGGDALIVRKSPEKVEVALAVVKADLDEAALVDMRGCVDAFASSSSSVDDVAVTATTATVSYRVANGAVTCEGANLRYATNEASLASLNIRAGPYEKDLINASTVSLEINEAYRVQCEACDVCYQGAAWGVVLEAWAEALPSSSSTSEDTVFALKAQRATVGAPGSRAGLRMARLSASTVECAVDGLGRWSVGAKRPRLETCDNSSVKQLADLGGELSCTVDWASDDGLIVKARAPAVRATSALTRYDHDLIRTVVWRTLAGGDDPITPSDKSLRVEVEAGAADLRLEDVGRIASTGVRLEVIRPHGAFTTFTVACAAATVYDRARKTLASPESTGGDAFEFSVGHGDADLNGIRASLTSLTARHTSVIWRAEAWWAFRDFFRYEYVNDTRDGPDIGPPIVEDDRPWGFRLALEKGRVALPPSRKRTTSLELRGASVTYDYDSREASHRGAWTAVDVNAVCGSLTLETVAKASIHLSPDGTRRHIVIEGAKAIKASDDDAFADGVRDAFGCVYRALGYDDDVQDEAPSSLLLLEARVDNITGMIGDREVSIKSLAYGRRRASPQKAWLKAARAASVEVSSVQNDARGILGRLALNAAPKSLAGALEQGFRADAQDDGAWVLDVPRVSVLEPGAIASLVEAVATHAPSSNEAGSLRLALGALVVQASPDTTIRAGTCRLTRDADSTSANVKDVSLTVDDDSVAACAALTLSSFRGRVAVACDALCRVDAARLNDAKEALSSLAALAPKSGDASQEPLTLAVGDLDVAHGASTLKGSLTAAYSGNKVDAHLQTTDATHGALALAAPAAVSIKLEVATGALYAEAAPVDLRAGAVACRFGKINLRRDERGTALVGRSLTGGTATCQAKLAADDGNPARPTAALAWASDSGWDAVLVADVPLKADPLDVQLRTLPRATVSIDVGGTAVDIRDASLAWEAGALKINDAAVSVGATSFTTSVQIDASIPRISVHAPLQYELAPRFAKAVKSVVSVLMAGGDSEECRAASQLKEGAFPMLDDVLSLYAALATRDEEAMPRVRTFAGAKLGLVLVRKGARIIVEEVGGDEAKVLGVRKGDALLEIAGTRITNHTVADAARLIGEAERPLSLTLLAPVVPKEASPLSIELALHGGASVVLTRNDSTPLLKVSLATVAVSATKIDVTGLSLDGFRSNAWEPVLEPCGATLVLASEGAAVTFTEELRVNVSSSLVTTAREACAPLRGEGESGTQKLALSSPSTAISFIEGNQEEPQREAFVVAVDGLFATYESGLNLRLACTSVQVDAHGDAAFPVVLRPTPKRDEEESNAPFVALSIDGNDDSLGGALHVTRSLDLNIDEATVVRALALASSLQLSSSSQTSRQIGRVAASRLKARLSVRWSSTGDTVAPELAACLPAIDASSTLRKLLDVFAAVERSRVTLPPFEIEGCEDTTALTTIAAQHYKKAFSKNALEIAGSLRALGNPLGLARGIQRGLEDAVREPIQGLLNAQSSDEPLEAFAVGFERGARSLAKHAVGGTAGSLAQITGNISRAASHLALDDAYLAAQRAKDDARRDGDAAGVIDTREEDIAAVDGLASGFDSFVGGIVDGVTTLVQAPVRGAEAGGAVGAAKGAAKGAIGMVVKPVVGVADAATDVLRGIRDTTDDVDEDGDEDRRVLDLLRDSVSLQKRPARALYGRERVLRAYSYEDSRALSMLLQACDELLGDLPPGADAFLQRIELGNASELVVAEGAVCLMREAGVDFVAPASLVLGCKREKSGEAVVLIAAAAPSSGAVAEPPRRHVVPFASEAHGDALADAVGDILARRALEAVPSF